MYKLSIYDSMIIVYGCIFAGSGTPPYHPPPAHMIIILDLLFVGSGTPPYHPPPAHDQEPRQQSQVWYRAYT